MIEEIETAWMVVHGEFPRCALCEEYLPDEYQTAIIKGNTGYLQAHKSCIHQLTLGVWSELESRAKANVPLNAPYDNAHIADPKVRKSLGLNTPEWEQALYAAKLLTGGEDSTTIDDIAARIDHAVNNQKGNN